MFETNSISGDEVIILKSRKGLIKLAITTGADLVPCYLFGNTLLYNIWSGGSKTGHSMLRKLSRRFGIPLLIFWGRFGLPIPYRVPILGVMDKPIKTVKNANPSDDEIDRVHQELMTAMKTLFDKYKASYGWEDKQLIIE